MGSLFLWSIQVRIAGINNRRKGMELSFNGSPPCEGANDFQNCLSSAQADSEKNWHSTVTHELRTHLVNKMVQTIAPDRGVMKVMDQRMNKVVDYAKGAESEIFEMANSRAEYYHRFAELIYNIQMNMKEKQEKSRQQAEAELGQTQTKLRLRLRLK